VWPNKKTREIYQKIRSSGGGGGGAAVFAAVEQRRAKDLEGEG
jgi:hypothetical protein